MGGMETGLRYRPGLFHGGNGRCIRRFHLERRKPLSVQALSHSMLPFLGKLLDAQNFVFVAFFLFWDVFVRKLITLGHRRDHKKYLAFIAKMLYK